MAKVSRTGGSGLSGIFSRKSSEKGKTKPVGSASKADAILKSSRFMDTLEEVEISFVKEKLLQSLTEIDELGKNLIKNPNLKNLNLYKARVRSLLKQALKKIYNVENKLGIKRMGQDQKVFVSVEKIDQELEELTMKFIEAQDEAISIVSTVEGIRGLLCNILA